jgi:hypothetical protein
MAYAGLEQNNQYGDLSAAKASMRSLLVLLLNIIIL